MTQSRESQTWHVTLPISWRAGISGYQIGTAAPKSMLKPVYEYPFKYTICESISCILFGSKSWHLLQLPVLTYCPEAHLFKAGHISWWWWWQGPLYLGISGLKWHNAGLLQILSTCAFSFKVYLSLDWQRVSAEPSEHGAPLRMVSKLVLASLKSQGSAAVFSVLWFMVSLCRLVGWWGDSVIC